MRRLAALVAPTVLAVAVLAGCGDRATVSGPEVTTEPLGATPLPALGCAQSGDTGGFDGCDSTGVQDPSPFIGPRVLPGAQRGGVVQVVTSHPLGVLDPSSPALRPAAGSLLSGLVVRTLTQYTYDPDLRVTSLVSDLSVDLGQHNDDFTRWSYQVRTGARWQDGTSITAADIARGLRAGLDDVRRVQVDGDDIDLTFDRPFPDLPYAVAAVATAPRRADGRALASGPYEVSGASHGRSVRLVRNPAWDPVSDPGRTDYPDAYVVRAVEPSGGAANPVGPTDVALDPSGRRATTGHAVIGGDDCVTYWALDQRRLPDQRVRRALALAFTQGSLLPPTIAGADPRFLPRHAPRPAVARALLRRAHATNAPVRWLAPDGGARIARALSRAGFDPQPVGVRGVPVDVRARTRCAPWPTAGSAIGPLVAALHQGRLDRRAAAIARLPLDRQGQAWDRLGALVQLRDQPYAVLGYGRASVGFGSRVRGVHVDPVTGEPTWRDLWLD